MRFFPSLFFLFLFSGLLSPGGVQAAQQTDAMERLRANVLALDRVQNNIRKALGLRKRAKNISNREERELLIFIDYLRDRNREYCEQLVQRVGRSAVVDLPCPEEPVKLPRVNATTVDEKLADLDQQLNGSLGEFDEMLLKEQERIAAHQPRQRESGGSAASGGAGGYGRQQEEQGNGSASGVSGGRTAEGQKQGQTSEAAGQRKNGREATAGAKASGTHGQAQSGSVNGAGSDRLHADDDIVARQLR
ncbi:MAG TPA: hypothetical protein ENK89_02825, partial [Desulfobulbaceae bacterium]|nr:hypothetical protein [Desulfobulbaceae bacterium]